MIEDLTLTPLDVLLTLARDADPGERISYRDRIVAHGRLGLEAMTDWLSDPRLGAFAVRVIEKIAMDPVLREVAADALASVDRDELPPLLANDVERALSTITPQKRARRTRSNVAGGAVGLPGQPGRGYWVMRTSPWEPAFVWIEALAGRLRQGWGSDEEQNLERIADAVRQGLELTEQQRYARRSLRMLSSWPGGMQVNDVIVTPNLPTYGRLSVFRLVGSYRWEPAALHPLGERFGHVLPVELLAADWDRRAAEVSDALRRILGVQTRLYSINGYGGDVEGLVGGSVSAERWGALWTEAEYETLFGRFPPDGDRPTEREVHLLAAELGRTDDAISWQWADGAAYVSGRSATTASEPLKDWLDRREDR
jgi:hypothetical protein